VVRAVKIIKKETMTPEEIESFNHEVNMLKNLDHPHVIKLYEVFDEPKRYCLVTELCKGGELFEEIVRKVTFSENEAASIIQ
jgi:calcium-dependent protein kinase